MAKRDPAADAISRVAALKSIDDPNQLADALRPLLAEKSNYIVARAAELAGERGVRPLTPTLVELFEKLLAAPTSKDAGCTAKTSIAKSLVQLEADRDAEAVAERGTRHAHWEASWGGSVDLAGGVRGHCAILLAAMGSKKALRCATELLAERDLKMPRERNSVPVRCDAARALTMIASDGAAAVLRFKALEGDADPAVISECLAGVIAIEHEEGLSLAERYLDAVAGTRADRDAEARAEAAMIAIGGSRLPSAFELLKKRSIDFLNSPSESTYLASIALTRQEPAIEYLLDLVRNGPRNQSAAVVEALHPLHGVNNVAARLKEACASRS
ncbi:MAG: hypothetical protein QM770_12630 [Tepidisphaeraceae bacterium]